MKQRFSSLDIKVIAHELSQHLTSLRVSNIYDLSSRIFLLKFAKPNHRAQLVVDSGFRCHLTSFARTTAGAPSVFVARLRKFLKTRRVTKVSQIGTDRILELQFSDGQYRLFLEFYAGGNIVLTDNELKILALHRTVNEGAEHERIRQGSTYNVENRQNYDGVPPLTKERLKAGLQQSMETLQANETQAQAQGRKQQKKKGDVLRRGLSSAFNEFPPILLDHSLHTAGVDTARPPEEVLKDESMLDQVLVALQEADRVVSELLNSTSNKGYITGKPNASSTKTPAEQPVADGETQKNIIYSDFHPFKPKNLADDESLTILEFEGFNKTVDEFFSSIEGQKLESRLAEREANAQRKLQNARQDQEKRIGGLQAVQDLNIRKAQAIEANLERVEESRAAINGLIAQGMDWVEIDRLIELEQQRHNPVAEIIKLPLKLNENTATLVLGEWDEEDESVETDEGYHTDSEPSASDDEDEDDSKDQTSSIKKTEDKRLTIDIDLALSGWSNARDYYDQKRTAAAKQEKTVHASTKALKSAEQKIQADLKRGLKQEKSVLRAVRTPMWFEKFTYFISSDGYLVIGGRDAQQNDTIYKRYLKKGDAYVHADLKNAASVVIKNNPATPDAPIPPSTLNQAGNLCVATSSAWDSKAVMSAWWTPATQVSKIAPTGDVLGPGNFHIKGEKNFLPPAQLLLGFAVMWRISDASKVRHTKHRVPNTAFVGTEDTAAVDGEAQDVQAQDDDVDDKSVGGEDEDVQSDNDNASVKDDDHSEAEIDNVEDEDRQDNGHNEQQDNDEGDDQNEDEQPTYNNPLQNRIASIRPLDPSQLANLSLNNTEASSSSADANPNHNTHAQSNENQDPNPDIAVPTPHQPGESPSSTSDAEDQGDEGQDADEDQATKDPTTASSPPTTTTNNSNTSAAPPKTPANLPRGRRRKAKKAAQKYSNQDPSDREAAMALLGSKTGQERAAAEAEAKKAKDEEAERVRVRRKEQVSRQQEKARAVEVRRVRAAELGEQGEGEEVEEEEGAGEVQVDLDALVGTPLPGDEILEAIPVCAPWAALGRYKYRVKLQPGTTKKGKAVREILGRWGADAMKKGVVDVKGEDRERMWPREVECIKGWREEEVFGVLPVGRVRVMMAGGKSGSSSGKGGGKGGKGKGKKK